jgi:hypothetical protein
VLAAFESLVSDLLILVVGVFLGMWVDQLKTARKHRKDSDALIAKNAKEKLAEMAALKLRQEEEAAAKAKRRAAEDAEKEEVKKQRPRFAVFEKNVRDLLSIKDVRAWVPMHDYRKALDDYIGRDDGESLTFFAVLRTTYLKGTTATDFDVHRLDRGFGARRFYASDIRAAQEIGARAGPYFTVYHDDGPPYQAKLQLTMDLLQFVVKVAEDLNDRM